MKTSVLLVDDHPVFRAGLRAMLKDEEGIGVVGEAGDGEEAVEQAGELSPDVIVMDITMPNVDGIEATRRITTQFPAMKVIALSIHSGKRFVENMLRAGAAGYVLKDSAPEDLVDAIRRVHGGDFYVSQGVSGVVLSEYVQLLNRPQEVGVDGSVDGDVELTEDEEAVLRLTGEGYAVKEIAIAFDRSAGAVQAERRRLMKKLGLAGATELAEYAAADRWSKGETVVEVPLSGDGGPAGGLPILATKFYPPGLPANFVSRKRLLDRLGEHRDEPLTLISAPAGYGKSTLIADWMASSGRPTVWLSLDAEDSDPSTFLTYLVTAVEAVFPGACANTRPLLQAPQLPPRRIMVGYLANDLNGIEASFDLVLDDYHRIHGEAIHEILAEVVQHPPKNVHWFILTRRDPPLPLASLRASGRLCEFRIDELQLTDEEAEAVARGAFEVPVEEKTCRRLVDFADGWITGLRLAALALAHRGNPETFIAEMDAGRSSIREYLTEQVLSAQTPEFRHLVLQTAILDRFCGPLCEAVNRTKGDPEPDGRQFIERLVASGFFLIPMDATGTWYHFHHLFQHLLEQKLRETVSEEEIAGLHLRASRWFDENGLVEEAMMHALKAGDGVRAAEIVESHRHAQVNADRWQAVERWLAKIPEEIREGRPNLLLAAAFVAVERFRHHELPALVERAEAIIGEQDAEPELLGELNLLRGQIQFWKGEPDRALEFFLQARGLIPGSQALVAGENELHVALARQVLGRTREANADLKARLQSSENGEPIYLSRLVAAQAFVALLSGDLAPAAESARRLESLGRKRGIAYTETWGAFLRVVAQFHWHDLDAALRGFTGLAEKVYFMHSRAAVDVFVGLALTLQGRGDAAEAEKVAQKLREFAEECGDPQLLEVAGSCEARLALWRNDLETALRWQRSYGESPDFPSMIFWLEHPAVTECRVLAARGTDVELREAEEKLAVLREGLENLHNTCRLIDVGVLQVLVFEKQGRSEEALEALQEVTAMAEPGGWIRPFVEAGAPMADMLTRLEPPDETAEFVRELCAAIGGDEAGLSEEVSESGEGRATEQPLIEPLTNRELDVLELIAERLYDKEIAERLAVSPGTVKSHLKHIYGKLDVGNRREAVEKAKALKII